MPSSRVTVLSIGGSDSSGGAGIQADLKAFFDNDVEGATVVTCLTAQNQEEIKEIFSLPPKIIAAQIDAVFEALPIKAVKIGMLNDSSTTEVVFERLTFWNPSKVVLDPVMVASSGYRLLKENAFKVMCEKLFPLSTLITPNLDEVEALLKGPCSNYVQAGSQLLKLGPQAVLIKGGHHAKQKGWDCLISQTDPPLWLKQETHPHVEVHGSGCRLSSSIAAYLAKGFALKDAVFHGKSYVHRFLHC